MSKEHPFAPYIRIIGKGKSGHRDLTSGEAKDAMRQILSGEVEDIQLGAFLMLLRMKEESPGEIAGFIDAIRQECLPAPSESLAILDWPSYAGKRRHLPWFLLSALLLAENGIGVLMHGPAGHTEGRLYVEQLMSGIDQPVCTSLESATEQLRNGQFAYLQLAGISPLLDRMFGIRHLMGLRSPVHTIARMLNPLYAPYVIQGIFHPDYRDLQALAGDQLGIKNLAVFKGEGGEAELNPERPCLVKTLTEGKLSETEWPTILNAPRSHAETPMEAAYLTRLWKGEYVNAYAEAAVIGTTAIALNLLGRFPDQDSAMSGAEKMWANRNPERFKVSV